MDFPSIDPATVRTGDVLIVRFCPMFESRGIVAARIVGTYPGGLGYQNRLMGVQGTIDEDSMNEIRALGEEAEVLLVGLPPEFQPPLAHDIVYRVGGLYIPSAQEGLLPSLSEDRNYQRSLEGLRDPGRQMTREDLDRLL